MAAPSARALPVSTDRVFFPVIALTIILSPLLHLHGLPFSAWLVRCHARVPASTGLS